MRSVPSVALLIETSSAYSRGLLHGIASYLRDHWPWSIHLTECDRGKPAPSWFRRWKGDGVIARIENASIAKLVQELNRPTVDMSAAQLIPSLPWVETDDAAVARLSAEHLLGRGFRHFAFFGDDRYNWSRWREENFTRLIRERGFDCSVCNTPDVRNQDSKAVLKKVRAWIGRLPRPLAVMASHDFHGLLILDVCRRIGISVPDEVAVIGVDNDEVLCELSSPPMSSVIPNTYRTGYLAAALLDRMMAGERLQYESHRIEPLGVAARQSTDVLAIDDENIVKVVRFIREHACEGINMKDVLKVVPESRRMLESRFRKLVGRTPHEEIVRVQLDRVKTLLAESELSLERIAVQAGFRHTEYLSVVFREKMGMPPSRFRALNQQKRRGEACKILK